MPYRTKHGSHYHEKLYCHGANIPCGTKGLTPCSDCCGHSAMSGSDETEFAPNVSAILELPGGFDFSMPYRSNTKQQRKQEHPTLVQQTSSADVSPNRFEAVLRDIALEGIMQDAPDIQGFEEISVRLPTLIEALEAIDNALVDTYGRANERAAQFQDVDIDNDEEMNKLLNVIGDSVQTLLDAYDIQPYYWYLWEERLHRTRIINTRDEWVQSYPEEIRESISEETLKRNIARFDGREILINREELESRHAPYLLLRVIIHENFHNVSMGSWGESVERTSTGFHLSECEGSASFTSAWSSLNEGMTEVLNHTVTNAIVGRIPLDEWVRDSGRPVPYLLCSAITQVIGLDTMLPAYMRNDCMDFAESLAEHTHGQVDAAQVNARLQSYSQSCAKYQGIWNQYQKKTGTPEEDALRQKLDEAAQKLEEDSQQLSMIFEILERCSTMPHEIARLHDMLLQWQADYQNQPTPSWRRR